MLDLKVGQARRVMRNTVYMAMVEVPSSVLGSMDMAAAETRVKKILLILRMRIIECNSFKSTLGGCTLALFVHV